MLYKEIKTNVKTVLKNVNGGGKIPPITLIFNILYTYGLCRMLFCSKLQGLFFVWNIEQKITIDD